METIIYDEMRLFTRDRSCLSHFGTLLKLLTQSAVYDHLLSTSPYGSAIDYACDRAQTRSSFPTQRTTHTHTLVTTVYSFICYISPYFMFKL